MVKKEGETIKVEPGPDVQVEALKPLVEERKAKEKVGKQRRETENKGREQKCQFICMKRD